MEMADVLERLGLDRADPQAGRLCRTVQHAGAPLPRDWTVLAAALARLLSRSGGRAPAWNEVSPPLLLGISGGQGSGKSTLAGALVQALTAAGARAATCSLDDFYLPKAERGRLARSVHPLLATRGVPGTHDVALLTRTLNGLGDAGEVALPVFDKGTDDLLPVAEWRRVRAPLDVLVLEGWCVGARAEPDDALRCSVNDLEADEDADGVWRRHVNDALGGPYAALWNRLHLLTYLQVPDMNAVVRWRGRQEQALPPERRMNAGALARFIAHYERITRAMGRDLPGRADLVVVLDENHRLAGIRRNTGF